MRGELEPTSIRGGAAAEEVTAARHGERRVGKSLVARCPPPLPANPRALASMDHEHELAEEWHRKDVSPETVLLVSLGALLLLGVCTQVVRQSTLPVVITLILMAIITMGSLMGLQSSLPATLSHGRPAYQSP